MNRKPDFRIQTLLLNSILALVLAFSASGAPVRAAQDVPPTPGPNAPAAGGRHSAAGGDFLVSMPGELNPASAGVAYNPDDDQFLVVGSQNFHYSAFGNGNGLAEYNLGTDDPQAIEDYKRSSNTNGSALCRCLNDLHLAERDGYFAAGVTLRYAYLA